MTSFSIVGGSSVTFVDNTPTTGTTIDFARLDNSFTIQINGVDLFVGGPPGAPNELQFQTSGTSGQTVRFADGDLYGNGTTTEQVWQLANTNGNPVVRVVINPDGTVQLFGVKTDNGALVPLELINGMTINTAAIEAAWNDAGPNTIFLDQVILTGPTNASGVIEDVPCFTAGTLIETLHGPIRVEHLKVADQVLTYDNGFKEIRWIGAKHVNQAQLAANPKLKPILIRADALGPGYPKQDLIVSPQHRILVSSAIAMRMFNSREVLIPAKKLLPLDGVEVFDGGLGGVEYWHFLFDDHEIVWSNGAPTESLFTGPEAMKAVSEEAREELQALFPEICAPDFEPVAARFIPEKGSLMKKLVQRHQVNSKPLYCGAAQEVLRPNA